MNCQSARDVFPELIDSRTAATAHLEARAHLASCPACQREFASLSETLQALDTLPVPGPSPRLRRNFYSLLEEEKNSAASVHAAAERRTQARRVTLWRWVVSPLAACALVAAGFVAGQRNVAERASEAAPSPATTKSPDTVAMQDEIRQLREQVSKMGTLVGYSLLQQQRPGNDRLRGVLTSATVDDPNDTAINQLITALAFDPNPNVRLRALEGLYQHAEREVVRAGVLASLPREQNPLVQVSMIDFLAAARDAEAKPTFERISNSDTTDENVRTAARRALAQL